MKTTLFNYLNELLDQKITELEEAMNAAKESRDTNTKSTAGDKHETGRAMMQIEMEQLGQRLAQSLEMKKVLMAINPSLSSNEAGFGSLVLTETGKYFISTAMGKFSVQGEDYIAISINSPMGQALKGKKQGDSFMFREREIKILEVL